MFSITAAKLKEEMLHHLKYEMVQDMLRIIELKVEETGYKLWLLEVLRSQLRQAAPNDSERVK